MTPPVATCAEGITPGSKVLEKYRYTDMFERNETTILPFEKLEGDFSMTARNIRSEVTRMFSFTSTASPVVNQGRIGLRRMDDRASW